MGICSSKKKDESKVSPSGNYQAAEKKKLSVVRPKAPVPTEPFTFAVDQPFTIQRIIEATYNNPKRKSPGQLPWFWKASVYDQNDTADFILSKIRTELKDAEAKFNDASIMSHEVNRLSPTVDKNSWLESVKASSWTGPYKWDKGDHYHFQSVTPAGKFDGLTLSIRLDVKEIMLSYTT